MKFSEYSLDRTSIRRSKVSLPFLHDILKEFIFGNWNFLSSSIVIAVSIWSWEGINDHRILRQNAIKKAKLISSLLYLKNYQCLKCHQVLLFINCIWKTSTKKIRKSRKSKISYADRGSFSLPQMKIIFFSKQVEFAIFVKANPSSDNWMNCLDS